MWEWQRYTPSQWLSTTMPILRRQLRSFTSNPFIVTPCVIWAAAPFILRPLSFSFNVLMKKCIRLPSLSPEGENLSGERVVVKSKAATKLWPYCEHVFVSLWTGLHRKWGRQRWRRGKKWLQKLEWGILWYKRQQKWTSGSLTLFLLQFSGKKTVCL